jgi:hypothetical protein
VLDDELQAHVAMDDVNKTIETRYRRAGERLAADSSLRDALTDEQAGLLLDWALAQVRSKVEQTAQLSPEEAETQVERQVSALKRVMLIVNRLVDRGAEAPEAVARERIEQLVDALCEVDYRTIHVEDMLSLEKLVLNRDELDRASIFGRLEKVIRRDEEE